MPSVKISVTVPEEIIKEIREIASARKTKLSHLVAEALSEKIRKTREESFIAQVNKVFTDPEAAKEQHRMAEDIAENTELEELPW